MMIDPNFAPASARARPLQILYAEDVWELRELMRFFLHAEGHSLEAVVNGKEAAAMVAARPDHFDLLMTDHRMPVMSGIDLVRTVRSLGFTGKIVVISASVDALELEQYRALGVDEILDKPIAPSALTAAMAKLFPAIPR